MTWNLSYGYGIGSEGTDIYQPMPKDHFESSLHAISELIRFENPDVVLLQEIDFDAKRSHFINELDDLSRKSGLLYRDPIISWNSPYVPYPGLKPSRHFGKVVSGGGILSRFPIEKIAHDLLPKPRENGSIYNYFYLNRYLQLVRIHLEDSNLVTPHFNVMNLHLEAFSKDNRELHLVKVQDRLHDYSIDLAGGDFNGELTLLSETKQHWQALPAPEATYPSNNPNQFLDGFILKKNDFKVLELKTLPAGIMSDHLPLMVLLEC